MLQYLFLFFIIVHHLISTYCCNVYLPRFWIDHQCCCAGNLYIKQTYIFAIIIIRVTSPQVLTGVDSFRKTGNYICHRNISNVEIIVPVMITTSKISWGSIWLWMNRPRLQLNRNFSVHWPTVTLWTLTTVTLREISHVQRKRSISDLMLLSVSGKFYGFQWVWNKVDVLNVVMLSFFTLAYWFVVVS